VVRRYGFRHTRADRRLVLIRRLPIAVPMATLLSASQPPSSLKSEGSQPAILSPQGKKRYFIVHGGLFSKDGVTLADVKAIDRYGKQPGQEGLMCELLWTDPQDAPGRGPSKRGVGVGFGPDVTKRWCEANSVTAVIRSHEVRQNGYAIEHGESVGRGGCTYRGG
jgi:serine/threonine-protein phosphatase 5